MAVRIMDIQTSGDTVGHARYDGSLSHRTALQCSMLCVKTAIEMIETIKYHLTTAAAWGQRPSWLYGVLHIYLAATVLLAARLAPAVLLGEISQHEVQQSWSHALDMLSRFQADNVSAKRCVAALMVLYEKLPGGATQAETLDETIAGGPQPDETEYPPEGLLSTHWELDEPTGDAFSQSLDQEWMPDFNFTDPYNMTWFHVTAPELIPM